MFLLKDLWVTQQDGIAVCLQAGPAVSLLPLYICLL